MHILQTCQPFTETDHLRMWGVPFYVRNILVVVKKFPKLHTDFGTNNIGCTISPFLCKYFLFTYAFESLLILIGYIRMIQKLDCSKSFVKFT